MPLTDPKHLCTGSLLISANVDVVTCPQTVRELAADLNYSITGQTMMVTATSGLARKTFIHGGGGRFSWEVIDAGTRKGLRLSFADDSPGIADISRAMTNGWTSGHGLGLACQGPSVWSMTLKLRRHRDAAGSS